MTKVDEVFREDYGLLGSINHFKASFFFAHLFKPSLGLILLTDFFF